MIPSTGTGGIAICCSQLHSKSGNFCSVSAQIHLPEGKILMGRSQERFGGGCGERRRCCAVLGAAKILPGLDSPALRQELGWDLSMESLWMETLNGCFLFSIKIHPRGSAVILPLPASPTADLRALMALREIFGEVSSSSFPASIYPSLPALQGAGSRQGERRGSRMEPSRLGVEANCISFPCKTAFRSLPSAQSLLRGSLLLGLKWVLIFCVYKNPYI